MFDYKSIAKDGSELYMEFKKNPNFTEDERLNVFEKGEFNGYQIIFDNCTFIASGPDPKKEDEVFMQYKLWMTRPERKVGKKVDLEGKNLEELMDAYEELMVGIYILKHPLVIVPVDPKIGYGGMIEWLRTTDFYTAPASTIYHESHPGGLLLHTLKVYNNMIELLNLPQFSQVDPVSASLVALTHDWCKIGLYDSYMKNVKDDKTGQWHQEPAYRHNQRGIPLGHGATSMYITSKFFRLSPEEACAIRWHMGRFNVCNEEINEFQLANEKFPLVHLIQFSDQLSITEYANAPIGS